MRTIHRFAPEAVLPSEAEWQGQPDCRSRHSPAQAEATLMQARKLFLATARPIGLLQTVTSPELLDLLVSPPVGFSAVGEPVRGSPPWGDSVLGGPASGGATRGSPSRGSPARGGPAGGLPAADAAEPDPRALVLPLGRLVPETRRLALFAVTLGVPVTLTIKGLFAAGEHLPAYYLDRLASLSVERAVDRLQDLFRAADGGGKATPPDSPSGAGGCRAVRFSPGYCGWDLSGQRALFQCLQPGDIGITLGESLLMEPLKSVSGVLLLVPADLLAARWNCPARSDCVSPQCGEPGRESAVEKE